MGAFEIVALLEYCELAHDLVVLLIAFVDVHAQLVVFQVHVSTS